jgi:D-sedoheptulose 7-phosphate isomerase
MREIIEEHISKSCEAKKKLELDAIEDAAKLLIDAMGRDSKVLLCGNGGSAADCQHMAGEFVGRFMLERRALPAISLATDTSILTALTNDYGGEIIFERQVEALGAEGDVLIAFSTSGTSENIIRAVEKARQKGLAILSFTGKKGDQLMKLSDVCIQVDSDSTPIIQESHSTAAHIICHLVEDALFGK